MELEVTLEEAGGQPVAVLAVSGEVDHANYQVLVDRARELHASRTRRLVIDLSGVTYLGSSALVALHSIALIYAGLEPPDPEAGWNAFHRMRDDSEAAGPSPYVKLLNPSPRAASVLDRTGMRNLFETYAERADAIGSF
jgi:anti-anti-sigma regulatory factor